MLTHIPTGEVRCILHAFEILRNFKLLNKPPVLYNVPLHGDLLASIFVPTGQENIMPNYFTQEGLDLRRKQIKTQQEKVKAIGKEAGEAAGINCDWHDNFGYEDAKRRLEMESGLLQSMLEEISNAQIVSVEEQSDVVAIGVTVELLMNGESKVFTIGGHGESDPNNGLISYNTPLARPLLKMEVGDSKTYNIAGKQTKVEIEEIYPPSYRYRDLISKLMSASPT